MTTIDMDRASLEITEAINETAGKYGLSPSAVFYVLKDIVSKISEMRFAEILTSAERREEPSDEEMNQSDDAEKLVSLERKHMSLKAVQELMAEKIAAGDIGPDGKVHVSGAEAAERTAARDNTNN